MNDRFRFYVFESLWILPSIAIPIAMMVAIVLSAFAIGIQLPGVAGRVDPQVLASSPPFDQPGLRQLAPGRYEVVIVAQTWQFTPNEIRVPAGSTVTFIATSKDVIHGFKIENTDVNMMLLPGQVSRLTTRFNTPGEYLFICQEYCGVGHHRMFGKVIVE
ncbi:MAG: cytochrome c oxidase subunit II [Chloroflexota bacterium]